MISIHNYSNNNSLCTGLRVHDIAIHDTIGSSHGLPCDRWDFIDGRDRDYTLFGGGSVSGNLL